MLPDIDGVVEGIWRIPFAGAAPESLSDATLIAGAGLEGDRYAAGNGTYSVLREPGRQLTLLSADSAEAALAERGVRVPSLGALRRNVVLRGVSQAVLLSARGMILALGPTVQVLASQSTVPSLPPSKFPPSPAPSGMGTIVTDLFWSGCRGGGGGGAVGWFGLGSTPSPDAQTHGQRNRPCATQPGWAPAAVTFSRRAGLLTAPEPPRWHTQRWHTREGDNAVPVCVACSLLGCLWVWGGRHVRVGRVVAWCSRRWQGGSGRLTLSPAGE